jgi:cyanophycinase
VKVLVSLKKFRFSNLLIPWLLQLVAWTLFVAPVYAGILDIFFQPPKGNLIIVGGGDTPDDVYVRFVALSGGLGKTRIAILPMASSKFDEEVTEVMEDFHRLGADTELVNLSNEEAKSEAGRQTS